MSTNESNPMLAEVAAEFLDSDGLRKTMPLERAKVLAWMRSDDLEVLGATNELLYGKDSLKRVTPPLALEESVKFRKHYYGRCLREYIMYCDWQWADEGFQASHGVVYWFADMWADPAVPRSILADLKDWMRDLLKGRLGAALGVAIGDHLLCDEK